MSDENIFRTIVFDDEINKDGKKVKDVYTGEVEVAKPFIKWVGGKTQIIHTILSLFPAEINNYREIFLGGGSVLLSFLSYVESGIIKLHGKVYAYDINKTLIDAYKSIQSNHKKLYIEVQKLSETYSSFKKDKGERNCKSINDVDSKEGFYYWIRRRFNTENVDIITKSSMFIFLNKSCFRGLFREGPNGFNVPFGNYKTINFLDYEHLDRISKLIKNVSFECLSFTDSMKSIEIADFIYLDPPYVGENEKSFVNYTESGFSMDSHTSLFNLLKNMEEKFLMSNSKTPLVEENFHDNKHTIETISCKRSINSKDPSKIVNEVLVRNY